MTIHISSQMIFRWVVNTLALLVVASLLDGVSGDVLSIALTGVVLGLVNAWIRPFVVLLTLPLNIMTFGLFTLVINALMLWLASAFVKGFVIADFWTAILASLILSFVSALLSLIIKTK